MNIEEEIISKMVAVRISNKYCRCLDAYKKSGNEDPNCRCWDIREAVGKGIAEFLEWTKDCPQYGTEKLTEEK